MQPSLAQDVQRRCRPTLLPNDDKCAQVASIPSFLVVAGLLGYGPASLQQQRQELEEDYIEMVKARKHL